MRKIIISTFLSMVICLSVNAQEYDPAIVVVPAVGWGLVFVTPELIYYEGRKTKGGFSYIASAKQLFKVSLYVEKGRQGLNSKEDCQAYYWGKASVNPLINKKSIRFVSGDVFERVIYSSGYTKNNKTISMAEGNFYGYREGYCLDVHISKVLTGKGDLEPIKRFVKSIAYYK